MQNKQETGEYFLLIDTATEVCSVALGNREGQVIGHREETRPNSHAELLGQFAHELLSEIPSGELHSLTAIGVSSGPGSYTGLRIGASYAKGLCFGLDIPLIAIHTTQAMAFSLIESEAGRALEHTHPDAILMPMIDARRMEVYSDFLSLTGKPLQDSEIRALILEDKAHKELIQETVGDRSVIYFGTGAEKAVPIMESLFGDKALYLKGIRANAGSMLRETIRKVREGKTEDVSYWTPFYLKEFQATTPKKKF